MINETLFKGVNSYNQYIFAVCWLRLRPSIFSRLTSDVACRQAKTQWNPSLYRVEFELHWVPYLHDQNNFLEQTEVRFRVSDYMQFASKKYKFQLSWPTDDGLRKTSSLVCNADPTHQPNIWFMRNLTFFRAKSRSRQGPSVLAPWWTARQKSTAANATSVLYYSGHPNKQHHIVFS